MYVPQHNRENDLAVLHTLMRDYSFATLVSVQDDGVPIATLLPVVLETEPAPFGTIQAHLALGNSQWRTLHPEREALVIFQGPHTYISPSWYEVELSVPTWNYATVHAYGHPRLIEDHDELYAHLMRLVAIHESRLSEPWLFKLPGAYLEKMMQGIVGFSLEISRLEGKFKMSQNRSQSERARISAELRASHEAVRCEVADLVDGARKREDAANQ
jgi:transcriptional regulator